MAQRFFDAIEAGDVAVHPDEHFLNQVLGAITIADGAVDEIEEARLVTVDERAERHARRRLRRHHRLHRALVERQRHFDALQRRGEVAPLVSAADAARTLALIEAIRQAAATGRATSQASAAVSTTM